MLVDGTGIAAGGTLSATGWLLHGAATGGSIVDHALDRVGASTTAAGDAVDSTLRGAGQRADTTIQSRANAVGATLSHVPGIGGLLRGAVDGGGKAAGGLVNGAAKAAGGIAHVESRIAGKGLDIGGVVLHALTGWGAPVGNALTYVGTAVRNDAITIGQDAHDVLFDLGTAGGLVAGGIAADARAVVGKLGLRDVLVPPLLPVDAAKAQREVVDDLANVAPAFKEAGVRHGGPTEGSDGRLSLRVVEGSLRHQIGADEQSLRQMLQR